MRYKIIVIDNEDNEEIENIECDGFELGYVIDKEDGYINMDCIANNIDSVEHKHFNIMFEEALNEVE